MLTVRSCCLVRVYALYWFYRRVALIAGRYTNTC